MNVERFEHGFQLAKAADKKMLMTRMRRKEQFFARAAAA